MQRHANFLKSIKVATLLTGLLITLLGVLGGVTYVIQLFSTSPTVLGGVAGGAGLLILGVGLGGALAWQANRSLRGRGSTHFWPISAGWLLAAYIPAIIGGQLLLSFEIWPGLTFPPLHILAAAIPPVAILAYVGRAFRAAQPGWRGIILHLTSGAFLSTTLGITGEIVIGVGVFFFVSLGTALTPGGMATIERLIATLQNPAWAQNPAAIMEVVTAPPVLITLLMTVVILAPLIEELFKPIGVALMSYRRPDRPQAFLWGVAGGAGFALAENMFNTLAALDVWGAVMLLRVGGTAMHCLGSGLVALGWQRLLVERRPWKLIGALAVSASLHGLWNLAAAGIAGLSLLAGDSGNETLLAVVGGVGILLIILLVLLTLGIIAALIVLTRRLRPAPGSADHSPTNQLTL